LHAGIADRRMWDPQFDQLDGEFRLIRPDLPGYGRSPIPDQAFSYVQTVHDLLDHLRLKNAWLVGNSFGGYISIDFALTHPRRVSGLVLVGPVASGFKTSTRLGEFNLEEDRLLENGDLEAATDLNMRMWVVGPDRSSDQVASEVREKLWHMQFEAFKVPEPENASGIHLDPPALTRLEEIRVPTLIITGSYDLIEIREHARELADRIPAARMSEMADAGHIPSMERPQIFNEHIRTFIPENGMPWKMPEWREGAEGWAEKAIRSRDGGLTGRTDLFHDRPWSIVMHLPSSLGELYFKCPAPFLAFEASLTTWLASKWPDRLPALIAAEPGKGWMLMGDGGPRLRTKLRKTRDPVQVERLLADYAQWQIELTAQIPEMLDLGVPDRRLENLPELYAQLLDDLDLYTSPGPEALSEEEVGQLQASRTDLETRIQSLEKFNIPDSLDHGDLHDGNVFPIEDRFRYFDWGDASITNPFVSLRTTFVSLENSLELKEDAPEFEGFKYAYLEPWSDYLGRSDLMDALALALSVAPLNRALTWHAILSRVDENNRKPFAAAVPSLLRELLYGFRI
ncbi:MAG: alpha/beta fold hydrolase, partial [Anaerolineales bacterium]|nr:alpha/beta fold hydrolase [Anaerolineales bacterium]